MPDAKGRIRGISVPALPWLEKEQAEALTAAHASPRRCTCGYPASGGRCDCPLKAPSQDDLPCSGCQGCERLREALRSSGCWSCERMREALRYFERYGPDTGEARAILRDALG